MFPQRVSRHTLREEQVEAGSDTLFAKALLKLLKVVGVVLDSKVLDRVLGQLTHRSAAGQLGSTEHE